MTKRVKFPVTSLLLCFVVFLFENCSNKSKDNSVRMSLQNIALKCDTTGNEMGRIVFELELYNNGTNPISLAGKDPDGISLKQKCFLISDNVFPDALSLLIKSNNFQPTLDKGKSIKISCLLDYDKLKYSIEKYSNKSIGFNDVRNFLNQTKSYHIIYMNGNDSTAYWATKPETLQSKCDVP